MRLFNTSKKASRQFFLCCERCELKFGPELFKRKLYKSWTTNGLKVTLSTILKVCLEKPFKDRFNKTIIVM